MAYGSWSSIIWTNVASNDGYYLDVSWQYRQDKVANKTEYSTTRIRLRAKAGHSIYANATVGLGTITAQRKTYSKALSISTAGSQEFDLTNDYREVSHNSDGTLTGKELNVHGYCMVNAGVIHEPNFGWKVANITSKIPSINRTAPTATIAYVSKTYNSITAKITSNYNSSLLRYRYNGGAWNNLSLAGTDINKSNGGTINHTFSGLSPNTSYKIEIQIIRDYNGLWSNIASITQTTNKPNPPTMGSLSITSNLYNSQSYSWIGGYGAGTPSGKYGYYRYRTNGGEWVTTVSDSVTLSRSPNTSYKFEVQLVDYYGQVSNILARTDTTPKPSAGNASNISITCTSKSHNSITVQLSGGTVGAGASLSYYRINFNGGGYKQVSNPATFSGLSPNTDYEIRADFVDNYGTVASNSSSITVTTNKPSAPTKGTISISNITPFTATLSISGFKLGEGASSGTYRYRLNSGSWVSIGASTTYNIIGLSEETEYNVEVQMIDNYGTASASADVSFTTLSDQAKKWLKINRTWKQGKVSVKEKAMWKKAKKVFVKKENTWKENVN